MVNAFEICDLNKDGEVTKGELKQLIESRGFFLSDKEATSLMDKFDKGKHGSITQAEFLQEMVPKSPSKGKNRSPLRYWK